MEDEKHENDHTVFTGTDIVAIKLDTGELHLFDLKKYGFMEHTLDFDKLRGAGYEVLGEL